MGEIPPELHLLQDLVRIHMPDNDLSGTLPSSLKNLGKVQRLQLTRNRLGGTIPSLTGMSTLTVLGLGRNWLTGTLPADIGGLTKLNTLGVERNRLSGTIPASLSSITTLSNLNLDHNFFSGTLAADWYDYPLDLEKISLNDNNFTGTVPPVFCGIIDAFISADCDEIECACCTECCYGGEDCVAV